MAAKPLISFIITSYNVSADMLRECISNILHIPLNESEREIILIDDGSDESPLAGIGELQEQVTYIRQRNAGVSVARNRALEIATGDYIQFVDGDDYLRPEVYALLLEKGKKDIASSRVDVILFASATSENEDNGDTTPTDPMDGGAYLRTNNLHGSVCCFLFRKNILGNLRFTPGVAYAEDEEFTPQLLLRAEQVIEIPLKAYFYRQHRTSATHQVDGDTIQKRLDDTHGVILRLSKLVDSVPQNDAEGFRRRVAQLTMDYLYNIIVLTHSHKELERRIDQLKTEGLFPLNSKDYTQKYKYFRKFINTHLGRLLLCRVLR